MSTINKPSENTLHFDHTFTRRTILAGMLVGGIALHAACENSDPTPAAVPVLTAESEERDLLAKEISSSYQDFVSSFLSNENLSKNQLRVIVDEEQNTVSEGMGYAMRFAIDLDDQATFEMLWNYVKGHLNDQGLMPWKINKENQVEDVNTATDGDIDIAYSLVRASQRWNILGKEAHDMVKSIMSFDVEEGTFVLKPGNVWGGSNELNPSYFDPGIFKVFAEFTNNEDWLKASEACYRIWQAIRNLPQNSTGFVPEWCTAEAQPIKDRDSDDFEMRYNGVRIAWRLSDDFADRRAQDHLTEINAFFESLGEPNQIVDGYKLDGTPVGEWNNSPFISLATIASLISKNTVYRKSLLDALINKRDSRYYNDALRLFGLITCYKYFEFSGS